MDIEDTDMKKTVFLTGGTGRVGVRVLRLLLERGYRVNTLIHHRKPEGVSHSNLKLIQGDLLDQDGLKKAVQDSQIICHLAATFDMFPPVTFEKANDPLFENLIRGTYNMLEAARSLEGLGLFLFTSTDAVYATGPIRYDIITEETELHPCPGRFYALAKAVGESLCINYGKCYGIPWIIIRINWALTSEELLKVFEYEFWENDIDPEERKSLGPKLAKGKGVFAPLFSDGESAVDQIADPNDTAQGIVLAIDKHESAKNNVFNIAAPAPFRYVDFIEKVADGLGVSWGKGKVSGYEPYEISNEKAQRMLGYNPKHTMEEMIERALKLSR
jgi:nucleoside-diphosphate-sugar epimerase